MKKINLNEVIYSKILIQANEAKELGFNKLADSVLDALTPKARSSEEKITFSSVELENNIHNKLWKIAMELISYHNLESVDIQKVNDTILHLAKVVSHEIEKSIDSEDKVGSLEPLVPGQSS